MIKSRCTRQERHLLAERRRIEEMLASADSLTVESSGDRGRVGDDLTMSTTGGSADDDRAMIVHAARELAEIDDALERLREDPGRYGVCVSCRHAIPLERLRLVPATRYCQIHQPG